MATYEEIQKIVLQVENTAKLEALNKALAEEKKLLLEISEAHKAGKITEEMYSASMRSKGSNILELNGQLLELQKTTKGAMNAMGAMQIGYALNDLASTQGGAAQKFSAIANNLQGLAVSMGVGGGWFIAIMGIMSALQAVAKNWDAIEAAFRGLPDPKELKEKAEAAKKKADEYKALLATPTTKEKGTATTRQGAITEAGADTVAEGVKRALATGGGAVGMDAAQTQAFIAKEGLAGAPDDVVSARVNEENERIKGTQYGAEAQRLMLDAQQPGAAGAAAGRRLADLAKKFPQFFPKDFGLQQNALRGIVPPQDGQIGFTGPPVASLKRRATMEADELESQRLLKEQEAAEEEARQFNRDLNNLPRARQDAAIQHGINKAKGVRDSSAERAARKLANSPEMAQLEASQLESAMLANQADAQLDAVLGGGPFLARQRQLEAQLRQLTQRFAREGQGQQGMGDFSFGAIAPW